jgi:hypothetical protein
VIAGIYVYGANSMLSSESESGVARDPVFLSAEIIEAGIANGSLRAGSLKNVSVHPPADCWPERWAFLRE